jgi:hypothetical protein
MRKPLRVTFLPRLDALVKFKSRRSATPASNPQNTASTRRFLPRATGPLHNLALGFIVVRRLVEDEFMARFLVATALVGMLAAPLLVLSYGEAAAQQRSTCSQALAHCGKQRVCQRRFENCMETGCWTVVMVKRCGYEKR